MKSTTAKKRRWERADGQIAARGANISPEHAAQLDLIRRSTSAIEPGGGRLVELIRYCMLGPGEEGA